MLTDPILVDRLLLISSLVVPIFLVWRFRGIGIILGAFANWIIIGAAGPILSALDPNRDVAVGDSVWILAGWLFGLSYSGTVYLVILGLQLILGLQRIWVSARCKHSTES